MILCLSCDVQRNIWCSLFILVETERVGRVFTRVAAFYGVFLWIPPRGQAVLLECLFGGFLTAQRKMWVLPLLAPEAP